MLQIPIGTEADFIGVVDLVQMRALTWRGETVKGEDYDDRGDPGDATPTPPASGATGCFETIAEADDEMMELYLEGEEPTVEALQAAIRRATIANKLTPVLTGTAFKNKGVQPLLDAVVAYLPSPLDIPARSRATTSRTRRSSSSVSPSEDEPFSALAFKIMADPHLGKLTYLRVYSGRLDTGTNGPQPHQGPARSGSARSTGCTPTSVRRSRRSAPVTSSP